MSEWLGIFPAVVAAVVSLAILWRQEKTKKEVEKLRHDLSREMFFIEQQYNEKRLLYLEILKIEDDISVAMESILMLFEPNVKPFKVTLVYVFDIIKQPEKSLDWKTILQIATEEERNEVEELNCLLNLKSFRDSRDKLLNMRTHIWLFSSRGINDLWWRLIENSKNFQNLSSDMILQFINEARDSNSEAEATSLRYISVFRRSIFPIARNIGASKDNLISIRREYIEISTQMLEQMRKELHFSED